MKKLIDQPHLIFFLVIPVVLLVGHVNMKSLVDINIHDTYFIVSYFHLVVLLSIFFGIIGILYLMMQKAQRRLFKWLTNLHIIMTIGGLAALFTIPQLWHPNVLDYSKKETVLFLLFLLIFLAQISFIVNVFFGIFRKHKNGD